MAKKTGVNFKTLLMNDKLNSNKKIKRQNWKYGNNAYLKTKNHVNDETGVTTSYIMLYVDGQEQDQYGFNLDDYDADWTEVS